MCNTTRPERVPAQTDGNSGQSHTGRQRVPGGQTLRKRLIEIAVEQGFDEDGVRTAVVDRMGKSIDDLTAAELGSAGRGRRQQAQTDSAGASSLVRRSFERFGIERGRRLRGVAPLFRYRTG